MTRRASLRALTRRISLCVFCALSLLIAACGSSSSSGSSASSASSSAGGGSTSPETSTTLPDAPAGSTDVVASPAATSVVIEGDGSDKQVTLRLETYKCATAEPDNPFEVRYVAGRVLVTGSLNNFADLIDVNNVKVLVKGTKDDGSDTISLVGTSDAVRAVQNGGGQIDFEYVYALVPQYRFHPFGPPTDAAKPSTAQPSTTVADVVIVDTAPPKNTSLYADYQSIAAEVNLPSVSVAYDTATPGTLDPVAGHGIFIAKLIDDLAFPTASKKVTLVSPPTFKLDAGEWVTGSDLMTALSAALGNGGSAPKVLNLSLGSCGCPGADHSTLKALLGKLLQKNPALTIVASAGNDASSTMKFYPAAFYDRTSPSTFGRIVSVGATATDKSLACYSNRGDWVSVWSPGTVISTYPKTNQTPKGYAVWQGTSFSAGQVTAALTRYGGPATGSAVDWLAKNAAGLGITTATPAAGVTATC